MAETSHEQDQVKKAQQPSEATQARPAVEAPQPEFGSPPLSLSVGPGLGSPDGFEKHVGDAVQRRSANRQPRAQTLATLQRQFGNQHVQRFMVQRRAAGAVPAVQREEQPGATPMQNKAPDTSITIDEKGVTNGHYGMSFSFKNEKPGPNEQPPKDVKPSEDLVTTSATVVVVLKVTVAINLPTVPSNLTACQKKRVKDAIDNKLAPHEKQHEAAMKTYDGTVEEDFTLTGIKRSDAPTARKAKGQEIADRIKKERETAAQAASDALDPFEITVDLDCEDDKKATEGVGGEPTLAGSAAAESGATGEVAA